MTLHMAFKFKSWKKTYGHYKLHGYKAFTQGDLGEPMTTWKTLLFQANCLTTGYSPKHLLEFHNEFFCGVLFVILWFKRRMQKR